MAELSFGQCLTSGLAKQLPSPLTSRPATSITRLDIVALSKSLALAHTPGFADEVTREIINQMELKAAVGELTHTPIYGWAPPAPPKTASALIERLAGLRLKQRQAVLFAVDQGLTLNEVRALRFSDVRALQSSGELSAFAGTIVSQQVRYISSNLVFWEMADGRGWPLIGIEQDFHDHVGMTFERWAQELNRSTAGELAMTTSQLLQAVTAEHWSA